MSDELTRPCHAGRRVCLMFDAILITPRAGIISAYRAGKSTPTLIPERRSTSISGHIYYGSFKEIKQYIRPGYGR